MRGGENCSVAFFAEYVIFLPVSRGTANTVHKTVVLLERKVIIGKRL